MTVYTPTVWQSNDLITAERLNKIENRIEEIQSLSFKFSTPPSYNTIKTLLDMGVIPEVKDSYGHWHEIIRTMEDYDYDTWLYAYGDANTNSGFWFCPSYDGIPQESSNYPGDAGDPFTGGGYN